MIKKLEQKTIITLIKNSRQTIQRWISEKRPIIFLLNKFYSNEDIELFLTEKRIVKHEYFNEINHIVTTQYLTMYKKLNPLQIKTLFHLMKFVTEQHSNLYDISSDLMKKYTFDFFQNSSSEELNIDINFLHNIPSLDISLLHYMLFAYKNNYYNLKEYLFNNPFEILKEEGVVSNELFWIEHNMYYIFCKNNLDLENIYYLKSNIYNALKLPLISFTYLTNKKKILKALKQYDLDSIDNRFLINEKNNSKGIAIESFKHVLENKKKIVLVHYMHREYVISFEEILECLSLKSISKVNINYEKIFDKYIYSQIKT